MSGTAGVAPGKTPLLRIAVPNKGTLAANSARLIAAAGFSFAPARERLFSADPTRSAEILYLRARDIPAMIAGGYVDAGITGRDLVADFGHELRELLPLGFGRSVVRFAVPPGTDEDPRTWHGKRIATTLSTLTRRHLAKLGVRARVMPMSGAVEVAVYAGAADAVADVVDSGRTLAAHGLRAVGAPLIVSESVLVAMPHRVGSVRLRNLADCLAECLPVGDKLSSAP